MRPVLEHTNIHDLLYILLVHSWSVPTGTNFCHMHTVVSLCLFHRLDTVGSLLTVWVLCPHTLGTVQGGGGGFIFEFDKRHDIVQSTGRRYMVQ